MGGGIFGSLFDFNRDGKLDIFEQGMEFMLLQEIMDDNEDDEGGTLKSVELSYDDELK